MSNSPLQISQPECRILGIETSCDETAAAVVENGRVILSSVVASQVDLHAQYGGIFPEVASRQHILTIYPIVEKALRDAHLDLTDVDAIAVTRGPGLPGSLVVGINTAKGMALGSGLPLIGVNHLEGHLYSAWLYKLNGTPKPSASIDSEPWFGKEGEAPPEPEFPLLTLIVSGGHTELVLMRDHLTYERLGGTLDDAAGEAFDKVARLLGLPYPGGPAIQQVVERGGDPSHHQFPRAWLEGTWNFSFSGLKTAVLHEVRKLEEKGMILPVADLAASFQEAVVEVLVIKTLKAAQEFGANEILVSGGVSANQALRDAFQTRSPLPVHIPPIWLCTDNAAMIAGAGCFRYQAGQRDDLDMDVLPNWPVSAL
jgi:N6-L-threonylcarbamoyladenine synthase